MSQVGWELKKREIIVIKQEKTDEQHMWYAIEKLDSQFPFSDNILLQKSNRRKFDFITKRGESYAYRINIKSCKHKNLEIVFMHFGVV